MPEANSTTTFGTRTITAAGGSATLQHKCTAGGSAGGTVALKALEMCNAGELEESSFRFCWWQWLREQVEVEVVVLVHCLNRQQW
jgi:hypothetical protein